MVDAVLGTIIAAMVTSGGAIILGIVNHLRSSTCWGVSATFDSSGDKVTPTNNK